MLCMIQNKSEWLSLHMWIRLNSLLVDWEVRKTGGDFEA